MLIAGYLYREFFINIYRSSALYSELRFTDYVSPDIKNKYQVPVFDPHPQTLRGIDLLTLYFIIISSLLRSYRYIGNIFIKDKMKNALPHQFLMYAFINIVILHTGIY